MQEKVYPYFDEDALMMTRWNGDEQSTYHTKLYNQEVHQISDTSAYAADRIICDKNYELGEKIFEKVIALQDTNPESETYGLWAWNAEESLEEMDSPDYNMADFNSKEMIVSIIEEGENLSPQMREKLLKSISMACECIMRRNVSVGYTNVCITDCFVTITASELTGDKRFAEYGKRKLKKFIHYVKGRGQILEYNSPCYSILAADDMGDLVTYIKEPEALALAKEANYMLWEMLAEHFEYDILQLAGPQERAYTDFIGYKFLRTIGKACRIDYSKHPMFTKVLSENEQKKYFEHSRTNPKCPDELIPYFKGEKRFKYVRRMVTDGGAYPWFDFAKTATTYRGDGYVIGTYNKCEFWNQRRPFLAYIHGEKPVSLRLKSYHDGYDFASSVCHLVQHESSILGSVNYSENRGDTHVSLDGIKDGLVDAEELKFTFEFAGDVDGITYENIDGKYIFNVNGKKIRINAFVKEFGDGGVKETVEKTDGKLQYNLITYQGERKTVNLCEPDKAIIAFTVEMEPDENYAEPTYSLTIDENEKCPLPEYAERENLAYITWKSRGRELGLVTPNRTFKFIKNMYEDLQLIDGKDFVTEIFDLNI